MSDLPQKTETSAESAPVKTVLKAVASATPPQKLVDTAAAPAVAASNKPTSDQSAAQAQPVLAAAAAPSAVKPAPAAPRDLRSTPKAAPAASKDGTPADTGYPKAAAALRPRHYGVLLTLALFVLLPACLATAYLFIVAKDQYASTVGFTVRREETPSNDFLGGLSRLAGSTTSDTDILYDFVLSQEMVRLVDDKVDLRAIYSTAWPDDPMFAYDPAGTIEDLHKQWLAMMKVDYDGASGLISLESRAFTAKDAMLVANAAFEQASTMINALSADAQADATRYTQGDLGSTVARLKTAREALTTFRMRTQIVDITSDIQSQMGILTKLQEQLANNLIENDILRETAREDDPRLSQGDQRIRVIEARIASERAKFGSGGLGPGGEDYATLAAAYEGLTVDLEFAEAGYRSAQAAHEAAKTAAQRQSRYLAPHIRPTLAEQALYPHRMVYSGMILFFLMAVWAICVMVYYSIRDRR